MNSLTDFDPFCLTAHFILRQVHLYLTPGFCPRVSEHDQFVGEGCGPEEGGHRGSDGHVREGS